MNEVSGSANPFGRAPFSSLDPPVTMRRRDLATINRAYSRAKAPSDKKDGWL